MTSLKTFSILLLLSSLVLSISCDTLIKKSSESVSTSEQKSSICPTIESTKQACCSPSNPNNNCFRAAVYEHYRDDRYVPHDWRKTVEVNLRDFNKAAQLAASEGANIIVYPEDGILIGNRSFIEPGLVNLPDPEALNSSNNNPCIHEEYFKQFDNALVILKNLSCIARENKLYVAANFGSKENCKFNEKLSNGRTCPQSGYFAYNTNVVLTPDGTFLKRYRKANLFVEVFDQSPGLETIYFDTPFGRFGIFTCFDMIFKSPAIDLVEKHKVDTILFPTWWYDEAPYLTAIQYQDGWSMRNQVNLLAANTHKRQTGSVGSGIYSGKHMLYTSSNSSYSKLLIASMPKRPRELEDCHLDFSPKSIDLDGDLPIKEYSHKNYPLSEQVDSVYLLNNEEEEKTICKGVVCCSIEYKVSQVSKEALMENKLVMIVRDGLRPGIFNWYEQTCSIATLLNPFDESQTLDDTIEYASEGLISFDKLNIEGTFTTDYVYPIAAYSIPELIERSDRKYDCDLIEGTKRFCKLSILQVGDKNKVDKPIYSFGMFARRYESDKMPPGYW